MVFFLIPTILVHEPLLPCVPFLVTHPNFNSFPSQLTWSFWLMWRAFTLCFSAGKQNHFHLFARRLALRDKQKLAASVAVLELGGLAVTADCNDDEPTPQSHSLHQLYCKHLRRLWPCLPCNEWRQWLQELIEGNTKSFHLKGLVGRHLQSRGKVWSCIENNHPLCSLVHAKLIIYIIQFFSKCLTFFPGCTCSIMSFFANNVWPCLFG